MATFLYVLFLALKQTRTTFVIAGVAFLAVLYLLSLSLDLRLTRYLFQVLFAVALVGLIVMFHEEIRISVERFLTRQLKWRRGSPAQDGSTPSAVSTALIDTVTDLARDRIGALILIQGRDDPSRFVVGGTVVNGVLSEQLLRSIFDPHSVGHDGAVIVQGDRVRRFACHLPLSTDSRQLGHRGTRHAAALGITEKCDGLCLVVSEERGTISVARHGRLRPMADLSELGRVLGDFFSEVAPDRRPAPWTGALRRHLLLKIAAVAAAAVLWYLFVHESSTEYRNYNVAPTAAGLRAGQRVTSFDPPSVQVVVSGPRRSFYLVDTGDFRVNAPLVGRVPGTHEVFLTASDVELPEWLSFVNLVPRSVRATIGE